MKKTLTMKPWNWLKVLVAVVATFLIACSQISPNAIAKMSFPDLSKGEQDYLLYVENGVLVYSLIDTQNEEAVSPDATIAINRSDLNNVILGVEDIQEVAEITGDPDAFEEFLGYLDSFEFWFNIVLP